MPVSRRFRSLLNQLDSLKAHFLPEDLDPTRKYTRREYDLARAYVVLVHAEIEAYIEDRATEIAHRVENDWRTKGRHSLVIRRICTAHISRSKEPWLPFAIDQQRIASAIEGYKKLIHNNHGIKEVNLLRLVFPLGIQYESLDPALLDDLETFGSVRGGIAHSSIKAQQPIDIDAQHAKVNSITKRLKVFDRKINKLR